MSTKKNQKAATKALAAAAAPGPCWSNNNAACVNTWSLLSNKVLGQHNLPFNPVGSLTMEELPFFNKVASSGGQVLEAAAIADMMTKLFVNVLGAEYEGGQNYDSAVLAMTAILNDPDKTVTDLAAVVDEQHRFLIENLI